MSCTGIDICGGRRTTSARAAQASKDDPVLLAGSPAVEPASPPDSGRVQYTPRKAQDPAQASNASNLSTPIMEKPRYWNEESWFNYRTKLAIPVENDSCRMSTGGSPSTGKPGKNIGYFTVRWGSPFVSHSHESADISESITRMLILSRHLFKHALCRRNMPQALAAMSELFLRMVNAGESIDLRSFACIMASACSNQGAGINWNGKKHQHGAPAEDEELSKGVEDIMHIVFNQLQRCRFVKKYNRNIYTIAYIMPQKPSLHRYAYFVACLQMLACVSVVWDLIQVWETGEFQWGRFPLAVGFCIFAYLVLSDGIKIATRALRQFWAQTDSKVILFGVS